jgi:hypothetical protein
MLGYNINVRPNTRNIIRASTQIFLKAVPAFNFVPDVIVIKRLSTLPESLLKVYIIISLLRKHGIVNAIIVSIKIFILKYIMVPLKYDLSS